MPDDHYIEFIIIINYVQNTNCLSEYERPMEWFVRKKTTYNSP